MPDDLLQRAPPVCLARLREHAVDLALADVKDSLQKLHDDPPQLAPSVMMQRRSQVLPQLKRIVPGRSTALSAVLDADGELRTDGSGMAGALWNHWKGTSSARRLSRCRRRSWFVDDAVNPVGLRAAVRPLLEDASA